MSLFTYGTLMFREVWQRIAVGEFPSEAATLNGYAIYRVRDAVFPGIVRASEDDQVCGRLYHGLDEESIFELEAYESDLYDRATVEVISVDGELVTAQAFVIPESRREALTDEAWDAAWFAKHELENYLAG